MRSGDDYIRKSVEQFQLAGVAGIIIYFFAKFFQLHALVATISETMKCDFHSGLMQMSYFMKHINDATVIIRIRDIKGNDM